MSSSLQIKTPLNGKNLRSILAKLQFCASFIPNFSIAIRNLYSYINRKDNIEKEIESDFKSILNTVAKAICLQTVPNDTKSLEIYVDCFSTATSSIMFCKKLDSNIPVYVAVQETIQNNEYLCSAFPITVFSKMKNLNLLTKDSPQVIFNTFQRIILKVIPYAVEFKVCDTSKNLVSHMAEATFSYPNNVNELPTYFSKVEIPLDFLKVNHSKILEAYTNDKDAKLLIEFSSNNNDENTIDKIDPVPRKYIKDLKILDNLIYFGDRLYIPKSLISEIIDKLHSKHYSANAMENLCKKFFIFNSLYSRIREKYNSCKICIEHRRNKNQLINSWPNVTESHERWHSDIADYLEKKFLLVTDVFSHFTILRKMRSLHAKELQENLVNIFSDFGKPKVFVSDNATLYKAESTMEAFKEWGIYQAFSIPMCPESNGHAEKNCIDFIESLKKCQLAINERIVKDNKTAYELFFSVSASVDDIIVNYYYEPKIMNIRCMFKKSREEKDWVEGTVIEQVHNNCFRIESDNKYFIRKGDSINFMLGEKIITQEEAVKFNSETQSLSSLDSSPTRSSSPDDIKSVDFTRTLEANDILNCLYNENPKKVSFKEKVIDHSNTFNENDSLFKNISKDSLSFSYCDNLASTSVKNENIEIDKILNIDNLTNENGNAKIPKITHLKSQDKVNKFIGEKGIKIVCATDGSCEKGRGLSYIIQTRTKNYEKSFRAALNQCVKALYELKIKKEITDEAILILIDNDYVARSLSSDLAN
uniref:RNA-directed DNA polymerase n=1 Tax=Strongyloides venezuelensis TaxID=75913 RepID=A0A0K0FRT3_STRVS